MRGSRSGSSKISDAGIPEIKIALSRPGFLAAARMGISLPPNVAMITFI